MIFINGALAISQACNVSSVWVYIVVGFTCLLNEHGSMCLEKLDQIQPFSRG